MQPVGTFQRLGQAALAAVGAGGTGRKVRVRDRMEEVRAQSQLGRSVARLTRLGSYQGEGGRGQPAASWAVLRCRKSPGASVVYPVERRRCCGRPGSPVPQPRGGSMAQARPVLWMPGLGAGRRGPPRSRGGASRQLWSCFLRPSPRVLSRGRQSKAGTRLRGCWGAHSPRAGPQAANAPLQAWPPPAGA